MKLTKKQKKLPIGLQKAIMKSKKKKRPEDIEWCVRITLMEVIDLPEPPFLGTRNTFVTFELIDENVSHIEISETTSRQMHKVHQLTPFDLPCFVTCRKNRT